MSVRRLLLSITLFSLLATGLFSRYLAQAETFSGTDRAEEAVIVGEWLLLRKLPDTIYVQRGSPANFSIYVVNTDDKFALRDVEVSDLLTGDCDRTIGSLGPKEDQIYTCTYENVQVPFTNKATATGINATNGKQDSSSDTARVEVLELSTKVNPETDAVAAPGGAVEFAIEVTNLSSVDVLLTSLTSPQFGDLADPQNEKLRDSSCAPDAGLPLLVSGGGSFLCTFTFEVSGLPGDQTFIVNAIGEVGSGIQVEGGGAAVVRIVELIAASLTAAKDQVVTGGEVKLIVTVHNLDDTTSVKLLTLEDAVLGDISPFGDCSLPQMLGPGDIYSCSYEQTATGTPGEEQSYILNVSAETVTQPAITLSDQASATVNLFEPLIHLPFITVIPRPTSCQAPLLINTDFRYQFYPDTSNAVYWFILTETKDVTVEINDFVPQDGQVTIYKDTGNGCDPATLEDIGFDGGDAKNRTIPAGVQQPGNYYVYVFVGSDLSKELPYSLIVHTQ